MSLTAPTAAPAPAPDVPAAGGRASRSLLACAALACALTIGSGAVRWWQARRVAADLAEGRESKIALDELPMTLGDWAGERTELDPLIVARTGSNDLITRRYVNRATGVSLDVIVLHGPASDIFVHTPELCYPRSGYAPFGEVIERSIPGPGGEIPYRSAAFTKGEPGHADTQEVCFSWRYNGHWTTLVNRPKEMERVAGMYKVQVARRLLPAESRSVANPCESFLQLLVPTLERRIRGEPEPPRTAPAPPGAAAAPPASPAPTLPEGTHR